VLNFDPFTVKHALKIIANGGFLTALECTKFVFGWDCAPDPTGGAYSAPPVPLAGLRRIQLLRKREGINRRERREGMRRWRGEERARPPKTNSWIRP